MTVSKSDQIRAFVADADNVGLCGQRGMAIDFGRLMAWLREDKNFAAAESVICSNWLSAMESAVLRAFGFSRFVESRKNCDDDVQSCIIELVVRKGVRRLYLASGDGGYVDIITKLQKQYGLKVHLLARRGSCSKALIRACQGVTYIDAFAKGASV